MLDAMNTGFARLREDAAAWQEFTSETAVWDATSAPVRDGT